MKEERRLARRRDLYANICNRTKGTLLASRARVANSMWSRLIGLLGRPSIEPGSGVWLIPSNSIHTIGMLFTFDVVMIDKDFKVVGLRELIRPCRVMWPNLRAESVIELPAHTIFKSRTAIGDHLVIDRYQAKQAVKPEAAQISA